jgi:hypothetical protein
MLKITTQIAGDSQTNNNWDIVYDLLDPELDELDELEVEELDGLRRRDFLPRLVVVRFEEGMRERE